MKQEFHRCPEITAHHKDKAAAWSQAGVCDSAPSAMSRTTRTGVVVEWGHFSKSGRKQGLCTPTAGSPSHHNFGSVNSAAVCSACLALPEVGNSY